MCCVTVNFYIAYATSRITLVFFLMYCFLMLDSVALATMRVVVPKCRSHTIVYPAFFTSCPLIECLVFCEPFMEGRGGG